MNNIYTSEDWTKDGSLKVKVGQYVADDVIEELLNSVPPTTYKATCFQPGEAYSHSEEYIPLYMTFITENGMWKYIGLCPKGSTKVLPEYDYNQSISINENDLKTLVFESIKKILKENHYNSGIFSNNPELERLERIVGRIENKYLEYDSDTDNISDWDSFIEGIISLYSKSKELVWFKKYNIKDLYIKYGNNDDMFFEDFLSEHGVPSKWDWLDEYLDNSDLWEQVIPGPEEVYEMIKGFISWVNVYFDVKEQTIVKELNQEKKYIITTLSQNIY